jgi:PKD repeat protein
MGKGIKPSLTTYGKYYVSLYGYEDDSVTSLHKDSIMFYEPPKANITTDKQQICRYSSIVFKDNSTIANSFGNIINSYLNFGDSRDTLRNINNKSSVSIHQYTDTGLFNIQYIISHNGCKDTLILPEHIKVINSPKSDFTIVKDKNCTPVLLDLKSNYIGYFDSMTWFLNGKRIITTNKNEEQILIKNSGNQEIMHIIYGYGCSNTSSLTIKLE